VGYPLAAIAAFLALSHELLILDEPTSELDPQVKYEIIDKIHKTIEHTLEMVGLAGLCDEDPLFLGKGQRQLLVVASLLAIQPEILIVD
jgi:energy-coupling factor transporter ATP-binding protein EcfA2